jgi:hypothetical protein
MENDVGLKQIFAPKFPAKTMGRCNPPVDEGERGFACTPPTSPLRKYEISQQYVAMAPLREPKRMFPLEDDWLDSRVASMFAMTANQ